MMESPQVLFVPSQLRPSQAVFVPSTAHVTTAEPAPSSLRNNSRQRQRRRRGNGGQPNNNARPQPTTTTSVSNTSDNLAAPNENTGAEQQQQSQQQRPAQRERRKPRRPPQKVNVPTEDQTESKGQTQLSSEAQANTKASGPKNRRNNNKNSRNKKRYPWRKFIPPGTMDPITLDPLEDLTYPPFALVANEPYEPVPEWPPKEEIKVETVDHVAAEEERQRRILEEQWGEKLKQNETKGLPNDVTPATSTSLSEAPLTGGPRHYNLYDGRALAYYLVSQLQFIDPLNRRDLTRDELINLDQYLRRHGLEQAGVVEAYDAKGITISTAGATAATAAGHAEILQQQAAQLLHALFGSGGVVGGRGSRRTSPPSRTSAASADVSTSNNNNNSINQNVFQQQYQSHEQQYGRQVQNSNQRHAVGIDESDENGIYGDHGGGMFIVDDDINPSLRGAGISEMAAAAEEARYPVSYNGNLMWSASHIRGRFGGATPALRPDNFPALISPPMSSSTDQATTTATDAPPSSEAPPSKSLLKIVKAVKKTDPDEIQRQRDAREEALRRAMMSNMSFGADATAMNGWTNTLSSVPTTTTTFEVTGATEGQLQRNKALAEALGVKPATVRSNSNLFSGWSRPWEGKIELDEYGNELNAAMYPDALILLARERVGPLLKLERKWKTFLASDTAASLPLQPMDRPMRTLVHEYAEFWKLKTESFDPEPRRYVHCVKLRETCAPTPLLSEAAKNWRGPTLTQPAPIVVGLASSPTLTGTSAPPAAVNNLTIREFPPPPERVPLPLKPRSINPSSDDNAPATGAPPPRRMDSGSDEMPPSTRFDALFTGRERPKLALAPRTRPLELPPFQPPATAGSKALGEALQEKLAAKARKREEEQQTKKRIVEAEFASSDEEASASSSEWENEEALYSGSEGE